MTLWRLLRRGIVLGLLLAADPGSATSPVPASGEGRSFVALSDLHFDPFFDPSLVADLVKADAARWQGIFESSAVKGLAAYGSDSNYPLLASTLSAAAELAPRPDFIVVTGDFLSHGFSSQFAKYAPSADGDAYRRFVQKTMAFTAGMIRRSFPRARIIAALGNNDSDCGDYQLQPRGSFLAGLARLWQPLLAPGSGTFSRTFPIAGYFSLPHPTVRHLRVVVLNTVLFSPKFQVCGQGGDEGARELAWFERTLSEASARRERVWLIYHVPPGIDAYATLRASATCPVTPVSLWRDDYLSRFRRSLARFPGLVRASFAGHTHMDEFRLLEGSGFIHQTPAVSPIFGNNPGFAVFHYVPATGEIADFRTYVLDMAAGAAGAGTTGAAETGTGAAGTAGAASAGAAGSPAAAGAAAAAGTAGGAAAPTWKMEYDFRQAFAQPAVDGSTFRDVQQAIGRDPATRSHYFIFYPVGSSLGSDDLAHWQAYWCGTQAFTPEAFAACYCPRQARE